MIAVSKMENQFWDIECVCVYKIVARDDRVYAASKVQDIHCACRVLSVCIYIFKYVIKNRKRKKNLWKANKRKNKKNIQIVWMCVRVWSFLIFHFLVSFSFSFFLSFHSTFSRWNDSKLCVVRCVLCVRVLVLFSSKAAPDRWDLNGLYVSF